MNLWLVGQFKDETATGIVWEFQGVFSTQELAEKACVKDTYFVAPVKLDIAVPGETMVFPEIYYPAFKEVDNES